MKVCKFGGTSLSDHIQIKKICDIVLSDPARRVVVVSAPGKRFKGDRKITDLLILFAQKHLASLSADSELDEITDRFGSIAEGLGMGDGFAETVRTDLLSRAANDKTNPGQYMDCLKAAGEDLCAKLIAAYLRHLGHEAEYINPGEAGLHLTDEFGNAQVLPESYANLALLKNKTGILIFPGFFGYSRSGSVVTFPRGGSDITGSILAAALKAEVYENFTDVDYVFVADPAIIDHPVPLKTVTYREMRELSYGGFSVLQEETLSPVYKRGIPVNIRNTNHPDIPGTFIVLTREHDHGSIAGIASDKGFCSINLTKHMMNREIGFGRKLLQIIEDEHVSFEHMPSGIDYISLILREKQLTPEVETRILRRITEELEVDSVSIERGLALMLVVGEGMQHSVGLAAKIMAAISSADINLVMINQGASEISMMFGINEEDADDAVRAVYKAFFAN
jgi:aspartate kinase